MLFDEASLSGELLYHASQWLIFGVLLALLLLAVEIGFRTGHAVRDRVDDHAVSQITAIEAAVLGLLALLLAFTFSMAVARYEVRRALVVKEANAVGTAALRAQLLPEPARSEVAALFREYVGIRIELSEAGIDVNRFQAAMVATERLQQALWAQAAAAVRSESQSLGPALLLASLNDVIDVHSERLAARENHVPEIVLRLELLVAIFAVGLVGYGSGVGGRRNPISTAALALLLAAVVLLIVDLDRPRRGLIQVSPQPLIDLQRSLEGAAPAP